jgi:serine/threonine protein kinase
MSYHSFKASGQQFEVNCLAILFFINRSQFTAISIQIHNRYSLIRPIGHGAYGVVISALDRESGQKVAIKKVSRAFEDPIDAKRILREIKLMKNFSHENVCIFHKYFVCT